VLAESILTISQIMTSPYQSVVLEVAILQTKGAFHVWYLLIRPPYGKMDTGPLKQWNQYSFHQ
jgi:hypothetical protein